jgi:hypothetical protein
MSSQLWTSNSIKVASRVFVEVRANEKGIVLGQGDDVWFHDLHVDPADADAIAEALIQGAHQCKRMRGEA